MHEEWLALAIDTDGCISLSKLGGIAVSFANSSKELTTTFRQRAEALNCRTTTTYAPLKSGKTLYTVWIQGTREALGTEDKLRFLKAIHPYLRGLNRDSILKKELAEWAIEALEYKIQWRYKTNPLNFMEADKWYSAKEIVNLTPNKASVLASISRLHKKGLLEKRKIKGKNYAEWRKHDAGGEM